MLFRSLTALSITQLLFPTMLSFCFSFSFFSLSPPKFFHPFSFYYFYSHSHLFLTPLFSFDFIFPFWREIKKSPNKFFMLFALLFYLSLIPMLFTAAMSLFFQWRVHPNTMLIYVEVYALESVYIFLMDCLWV